MSKNAFGFHFDNTYARLPAAFFAKVDPAPVRSPKIAIFNHALAETLGLDAKALDTDEGAAIFAGNVIAPGSEPIAQAYAGHQFGHFNMLGDGRANLLGEQVNPQGLRFDIHLKGSGQTPYSRRGDGRAALGPMLREYIISEAMHALRIPTTRSLAVATTGETVFRDTPVPGGILTRIAASHIRVGTFEYAAAMVDMEHVRILADYTLARHYPDLASHEEPYVALLHAVIERQAALVAKWIQAGFIHGVMNTDNMTLSGETIDYGPCAFMNHYSPSTVFSSIDRDGRYAFGNQPGIALWNLTRLAEAILPLFSTDEATAVTKAQEAIATFAPAFQRHWLNGMRAKLGLTGEDEGDVALIRSLLAWMEQFEADYTDTFRALSLGKLPKSGDAAFLEWHKLWQARGPSLELMRTSNPAVIPRNHRVEEALAAAVERDDYSAMHRLIRALKSPYEDSTENAEYLAAPLAKETGYKTFCGT